MSEERVRGPAPAIPAAGLPGEGAFPIVEDDIVQEQPTVEAAPEAKDETKPVSKRTIGNIASRFVNRAATDERDGRIAHYVGELRNNVKHVRQQNDHRHYCIEQSRDDDRRSYEAEMLRRIPPVTETLRGLTAILQGTAAATALTEEQLIEELLACQKTFPTFAYDSRHKTISIVSEPITLSTPDIAPVEFGRFKISLFLEASAVGSYACIAETPNRPGRSSHITHPHVSEDRLCSGEGSAAIASACRAGRWLDFFDLVLSILNTYSPDSPYVALEQWGAIACGHCGDVITSGPTDVICRRCEHTLCRGCVRTCRQCGGIVCCNCSAVCPICEEYICGGCYRLCPCGLRYCEECVGKCNCRNDEVEVEAAFVMPTEAELAADAPRIPEYCRGLHCGTTIATCANDRAVEYRNSVTSWRNSHLAEFPSVASILATLTPEPIPPNILTPSLEEGG